MPKSSGRGALANVVLREAEDRLSAPRWLSRVKEHYAQVRPGALTSGKLGKGGFGNGSIEAFPGWTAPCRPDTALGFIFGTAAPCRVGSVGQMA
ncbi:hypothetical protein OH797_00130 [Streptomyces anulatus]|uniref:hypothetical protein n=1 Tax=Streptomyces TaxID=1883 RepID=UPI001F51A865|nr:MULTISPECIES: hypothetical protein [Streptomyces]